MSSDFYLLLPAENDNSTELASVTLSWVYKDVNNDWKSAHGLLSDASIAASNHDVTVVLAGENVLFLNAQVPGKNIQHIQQAVPYVLEDSVIDDVDDLHFAVSKATINKIEDYNKYNVSVINKVYLESIIAQLKNVGIEADNMIADYLLLADAPTLFYDGARLLFNAPELKLASNISAFEKISLTEYKEVDLISCEENKENESLEKLTEDINCNKIYCDSSNPLLCLIKNSSEENIVNLLQGSYKKKKNWSQTSKTWMPVAILFFIWLSVQGGLFVIDYVSLSKKNSVLNTEIVKIYKQTFPKSRRIVNAKAQMEQKLIELKKRKGQSGRSFSEMLSASAAVFAAAKGLKIKSLRYYDGRINLELQISSLQALDKLKNQLNTEKGYQVEIQNASSGKENVTARIQIKGVEL